MAPLIDPSDNAINDSWFRRRILCSTSRVAVLNLDDGRDGRVLTVMTVMLIQRIPDIMHYGNSACALHSSF